jgi:hypothetical protein
MHQLIEASFLQGHALVVAIHRDNPEAVDVALLARLLEFLEVLFDLRWDFWLRLLSEGRAEKGQSAQSGEGEYCWVFHLMLM